MLDERTSYMEKEFNMHNISWKGMPMVYLQNISITIEWELSVNCWKIACYITFWLKYKLAETDHHYR